MAREVEFGNEVGELEMLDTKIGVEAGKSLEVVDRPLASDIIRNDDVVDRKAF
jgi:hypothetical protein